jgi:tetratricopeptide (TPR) repeat protein
MKKYTLINNILGWVIFLIATTVYLITAEPTASWWDCGEYIATADKLQVGHPPGAPTFQLIGSLFSNFAGSDTSLIAYTINAMSAVCSGFTILFLFWSITMLAKKFVKNTEEMTKGQMIAIFASAVVGSLAYTFSDTFWYSAVEGEVYAMSSCFTAISFWAILKWEAEADDKHNLRWLILIAFLIGISIGVHLLNLLAIPAITYVFYFKKYPNVEKNKKRNFILVGIISMLLVAVILYFIVPYIVIFAGKFEIFFTNSIGLPFNFGTIIYFVLLIGLLVAGVLYSIKKQKVILNTALLSVLFILIGYTTFFVLVIRSNANTPINENAPKDATALLTYLNREQYGYTPLFHGQYYNAMVIDQEEGTSKYIKDKENGKYIEVKQRGNLVYEKDKTTIFPRMWSNDQSRNHPTYYKMWAGINESSDRTPTFAENLSFFFRYQVNHMYWRYFMWNFAGRQNDIQSHGILLSGNEPTNVSNGKKDLLHGNWITGIDFIDEMRLGPQDNLPVDLANNAGKNKLFCLPLLLGLAGLIFHIRKSPKDSFIVFLLFFMTGLAIVLYLNQPPAQPRERDYAYAGSFYAFAIWIGLGVYALYEWTKKIKKIPDSVRAGILGVICLFAVPVLMASEEWDDHDRSGRYMAREYARNYLESCEKDAILITFGDNDTFPLWYAQEVEGIRTDVRVLNYTLSGMHWYIEQLYNKVYKSEKLPFTLDKKFYGMDLDVSLVTPSNEPYREITSVLKELKTNPNTTTFDNNGDSIKVLPTNRFYISFDKAKAAAKGIYPKELVDSEEGRVEFEINIPQEYRYEQLIRNELMLLDILGTNHFERPIYVMNPRYLAKVFPNIQNYIRQEGIVYRIMPYPTGGGFDMDKTYKLFTEKFQWGGVNQEDVYLEEAVSVNNSKNMRGNFSILANYLVENGQKQKAINVLDKAVKEFPNSKLTFDRYDIALAEVYLKAGEIKKGQEVLNKIISYYISYVNYLNQFKGKKASCVEGEKQLSIYILAELGEVAENYGLKTELDLAKSIPQVAEIISYRRVGGLLNSYVARLNQAAGILSSDRARAESELLVLIEELDKNVLSTNEQEVINQTGRIFEFINNVANANSLTKVQQVLLANSKIQSLLNSLATAQ